MYFMYLLYGNYYEVPQIWSPDMKSVLYTLLFQEIIFLFQENPLYLLYEQKATTKAS